MASADKQRLFYSGERIVADGPLVMKKTTIKLRKSVKAIRN